MQWPRDETSGGLHVEEGSLYPALYRTERDGWVESRWGMSELGRRAKFHRINRAGIPPVVIGIVIGLGASYLGSRLVAGLRHGIAPADTFTFAAVTLVLGIAGLAAAYLPARRAARVDPLWAIRVE